MKNFLSLIFFIFRSGCFSIFFLSSFFIYFANGVYLFQFIFLYHVHNQQNNDYQQCYTYYSFYQRKNSFLLLCFVLHFKKYDVFFIFFTVVKQANFSFKSTRKYLLLKSDKMQHNSTTYMAIHTGTKSLSIHIKFLWNMKFDKIPSYRRRYINT